MRALLVVPLVGILVLGGCAADSPESDSSAAASAEATPTETATSTAPATKPELGDLELTTEGVGPIHVGETIVEGDPAISPVLWTDALCGWPAEDIASGMMTESSGWAANFPLMPKQKSAFVVEQSTESKSAPVSVITVFSSEIRTSDGWGVGTPIVELVDHYGSALAAVSSQNDSVAHVVTGTSGKLVFWENGDDEDGVVDFVEVIPVATEPTFRGSIGPCV